MEHKLRRHRLVCARQAPWSSNVASALGRSVDSAAGEIRAQFVDAGWGKDVPEMLRLALASLPRILPEPDRDPLCRPVWRY